MNGPQREREQKIHIGTLIKQELERQERSVSWFARRLNCDRSNVYKIFKRATIDTELLLRIARILNHDFFAVYQQQAGGGLADRLAPPLYIRARARWRAGV